MSKFPTSELSPNILKSLAKKLEEYGANDRVIENVMNDLSRGRKLSDYDLRCKMLQDWLFKDHSAFIVKKDRRLVLRFMTEDQMVMFLLQWG